MNHFSLVRPEHTGPTLKVVHFDWSGHFRWLNRNVPFHLTKLMSPVLLFCILLTRTKTKRALAWVRSVQQECRQFFGICFCKLRFHFARKISEISNWNFCCEWKVPTVEGCTVYRYFELKTCTLLEATL